MKNLAIGMIFKTHNTPKGCYHIITDTNDKYTTHKTVHPNGMQPFTSGSTKQTLRWLNRPNIGLQILNPNDTMLQKVLNAADRMSDAEYKEIREELMLFQSQYGAYMTGSSTTPPTLPMWAE